MNDQLIISKLNEINNKLDKLLCAEAVKPPVKKITIEQAEVNKEFRFKCISEEQYNKYIEVIKRKETMPCSKASEISLFNTALDIIDRNNYKYEQLIGENEYKQILNIIIYNYMYSIPGRKSQISKLITSIKYIYNDLKDLEEILNRLKYYYKIRFIELEHNKRPDVLPPKTEAKPAENIEPKAIGLEFINRECIF